MNPIISLLAAAALLSPSPLHAEPRQPPELTFELLWERGGIEAGPEEVWVEVTGGSIIDDAVLVLDMRDPSVRLFDIDGTFLATLGGPGAGPGEYERPTSISARGDSLALWDFALRRMVLFDPSGRHLGTRQLRPFPSGRYAALMRVFFEADGTHSGITGSVVDDSQVYGGALIQWAQADRVDTLSVLHEEPLMGLIGGEGAQWNRPSWRGSLGPVVVADQAGVRLVVVDGRTSTAIFYDRDEGGYLAGPARTLPGELMMLGEEDQEELLRRLTDGLDPDWREFRLPESLPAWSAVFASSESEIWVRRGGTGGDFGTSEEWLRWSERSGTIGTVTLLPRETMLDAAGDLVLAVGRGEFDESYVRLYQVTHTVPRQLDAG